jgi:hypothetical protein
MQWLRPSGTSRVSDFQQFEDFVSDTTDGTSAQVELRGNCSCFVLKHTNIRNVNVRGRGTRQSTLKWDPGWCFIMEIWRSCFSKHVSQKHRHGPTHNLNFRFYYSYLLLLSSYSPSSYSLICIGYCLGRSEYSSSKLDLPSNSWSATIKDGQFHPSHKRQMNLTLQTTAI